MSRHRKECIQAFLAVFCKHRITRYCTNFILKDNFSIALKIKILYSWNGIHSSWKHSSFDHREVASNGIIGWPISKNSSIYLMGKSMTPHGWEYCCMLLLFPVPPLSWWRFLLFELTLRPSRALNLASYNGSRAKSLSRRNNANLDFAFVKNKNTLWSKKIQELGGLEWPRITPRPSVWSPCASCGKGRKFLP